jgi:hypothetical protein
MTAFTSFLATEHSSAIFWISSDFDIMGLLLLKKLSAAREAGFAPVSP